MDGFQVLAEDLTSVWFLSTATRRVVIMVPHVTLGGDGGGRGRCNRCQTGCDWHTLLSVRIPVKYRWGIKNVLDEVDVLRISHLRVCLLDIFEH